MAKDTEYRMGDGVEGPFFTELVWDEQKRQYVEENTYPYWIVETASDDRPHDNVMGGWYRERYATEEEAKTRWASLPDRTPEGGRWVGVPSEKKCTYPPTAGLMHDQ